MFSTKERDFSTGLDYFGFRYYDPILGKFTTRDPSGYPDGPNNYLYCKNNPINHIDPLGLDAVDDELAKNKQYVKKVTELAETQLEYEQYLKDNPDAHQTTHHEPQYYYPGGTTVVKDEKSVDYENRINKLVQKIGEMRMDAEIDFLLESGATPFQAAAIASRAADPITNAYQAATGQTQYGDNLTAGQRTLKAVLAAIEVLPAEKLGSLGAKTLGKLSKLAKLDKGAAKLLEKIKGAEKLDPATAARGRQSQLGGIIEKTPEGNVMTTGTINQNDIAYFVEDGLHGYGGNGKVDIISGAHGFPDKMVVDKAMYEADVARFGNKQGVTVHNLPDLSPEKITELLKNQNTTIGGFCNSQICLEPFK